ncbi:MAG TPA: hypothetical protein EYG92_06165 [Lutibacter sp.]|nr:hypothetical protein [Lutibacter sp.]
MKRKDIYTLGVLFILTILTALFSNLENIKYVAFIILALSGIKFLFVAFQFMELKKAHALWKGLIIGLIVFFIGAISLIVQ